jgi:hypothetical protein
MPVIIETLNEKLLRKFDMYFERLEGIYRGELQRLSQKLFHEETVCRINFLSLRIISGNILSKVRE